MKSSVSGWLAGLLVVPCTLPGTSVRGDNVPLATRAQAVLKTYCQRCHGKDGAAKGGMNYILDRSQLVARNKITPGQPAASQIYQRVRDGEMPPPEQKLRPGKDDLAVLEQWIAAGAPAVADSEVPWAFVSEANLQRLIWTDLQAIDARQRRFIRYLTLTHLANAGLGANELNVARLGLAKLLNSLSWHPRLVLPHAVDAGQTVFRIDLRDLKWNARSWERLQAVYPYRTPSSGAAKTVAAATGSELPPLRADWFVTTASRPPLYHDLLHLPGTDRQLERQLQVDVLADIQEESVARAGFTDSGVSKNNRLIERHDAGYGAYWRSYDFSDSLERQNLFQHPLGPVPAAQSAFVHAGGEIIFNLPNGLQAYLLVDGNGRRLDQAPIEIVSDPKRPDRKVENGLSCMSCHVRGIIPKADQVRAHVLKNPQAFPAANAETIQALYLPAARMQALMKEDGQRFETALAKLGIAPGQDEPIAAVAQRYEGTLDLAGAAAEVGLAPADFTARLGRSVALTRSLGALRVKGGTVQRDTFQAAFANLVRELQPGEAPGSEPVTVAAPAPLAGHTGSVRCIAFSPAGRQAVSGSDDKTVRLWEVAGGRELRRLDGHEGPVTAVAFSADGRRVVSAGADRTVRVWEAATGRQLQRFTGHTDTVRAVAFSPAGRWVLSGSQDGTIRLWDLTSGGEVRSFAGHAGWVTSVAFSPDGHRILSGGYDRTVRVWNAATGQELHRLEGHTREVYAVAFGVDGRLLSGGNDKTVRLWDGKSGKELRRFEGHANAVVQVALTPDGRQVLSASSQYQAADKTFRVWDAESGRELYSLGGAATDRVGCAAFAPDGRSALSGSSDQALRFWKLSK